MDKKGIIIVIEDDLDDQFVLEEAFVELDFPNKRIYFPDGFAALDYLHAQHCKCPETTDSLKLEIKP